MLILSRNNQQTVVLETSDGLIHIKICGIKDGQVKLGFDAPDSVDIWRSEIEEKNAVNYGREIG